MADDTPDVQQQDAPVTGQLTPPQESAQPQGTDFAKVQSILSQPSVPQMGMTPNVMNLYHAIAGDRGNRLEHFESFLGNFLQSFAAGMATPPGPGANMRAAAAGMTAPYNRAVQQFGLQQQQQQFQSEEQLRQSQGRLAESQATEVYIPGVGMMPAKNAQGIIEAQARAAATTGAAATRAGAVTQAAQIRATSATDVANIRAQTEKQRNEITDAFNKGRIGELTASNNIKRMSVEDQDKYHMAMIPILQETAAARDVAAKANDVKALTDAGNKMGMIARISSALGWNDVGDAANQELQKTIQQSAPPINGGAKTPQFPQGGGKMLTDKKTAQIFLDAAGGDANKARLLAIQSGWKF